MEAEFRSLRGWGIGMMEPDIRIIECMQIPEMETRIKSLKLVHTKYGVQRIDIRNSTQNKKIT